MSEIGHEAWAAADKIAAKNEESRAAWNANAGHWDDYMGAKGNSFVNDLIWPAVERLLPVTPGQRILDAACGNGMYARRFAALGAEVVAFDFADALLVRARAYAPPAGGSIDYHLVDATDEAALVQLGAGTFDGASCQMAIMDMPTLGPIMQGVAQLLKPGGAFVCSVTHPAFNQSGSVHMAERVDQDGALITTYSVKISRYLTAYGERGIAIPGQQHPQPYFNRALQDILQPAFAAGLMLDGLEERSFPAGESVAGNPLSWNSNFSEIPPVLVIRLRKGGQCP